MNLPPTPNCYMNVNLLGRISRQMLEFYPYIIRTELPLHRLLIKMFTAYVLINYVKETAELSPSRYLYLFPVIVNIFTVLNGYKYLSIISMISSSDCPLLLFRT